MVLISNFIKFCLKNKTINSIVLNATNEFTHIVLYKNAFTLDFSVNKLLV